MPTVIALVDEMLFLSRILEAARGAGVELRAVRAADELLAAARAGAALVIVDADSGRIPWQAALAALRAEPLLSAIPVVAFYSHVHDDRAALARSAGATRVLARGAFVRELKHLLGAAQGDASEERSL
jgi:CheY-like chemotaxis protein